MKRLLSITAMLLLGAVTALCQNAPQDSQQGPPPQQRGNRGMRGQFRGTMGTITAISGDTIKLKTMDGKEATVKVTSETRFRHEGKPDTKLSDFKVGEVVFVAGEPSGDNTWTARMIGSRGPGGPGGRMMMDPADMGKKFIIGEVTKIDGVKLTIKRTDGVEQVIEVDDDTSFRNMRRESVTLADVKIGERVAGRGEVKNGIFVPTVLMVGLPEGRMFGGPGGPPPNAPR